MHGSLILSLCTDVIVVNHNLSGPGTQAVNFIITYGI